MFLCDHYRKFCTFSILYLWNKFSGKWNSFSKTGVSIFYLKALRLKTHHFHTKLTYQKPMLQQIELWVQNGPIRKNGVWPVTTLYFWKICFSLKEPLIKRWFDVPTTQMPIFVHFVGAGILFDGTFSLWVSLKEYSSTIW